MTQDTLRSHIDEIASECLPLPKDSNIQMVEDIVRTQMEAIPVAVVPYEKRKTVIEQTIGRTIVLNRELLNR